MIRKIRIRYQSNIIWKPRREQTAEHELDHRVARIHRVFVCANALRLIEELPRREVRASSLHPPRSNKPRYARRCLIARPRRALAPIRHGQADTTHEACEHGLVSVLGPFACKSRRACAASAKRAAGVEVDSARLDVLRVATLRFRPIPLVTLDRFALGLAVADTQRSSRSS